MLHFLSQQYIYCKISPGNASFRQMHTDESKDFALFLLRVNYKFVYIHLFIIWWWPRFQEPTFCIHIKLLKSEREREKDNNILYLNDRYYYHFTITIATIIIYSLMHANKVNAYSWACTNVHARTHAHTQPHGRVALTTAAFS